MPGFGKPGSDGTTTGARTDDDELRGEVVWRWWHQRRFRNAISARLSSSPSGVSSV